MPDPTKNKKGEGGKICFLAFFIAINSTKFKFVFIPEQVPYKKQYEQKIFYGFNNFMTKNLSLTPKKLRSYGLGISVRKDLCFIPDPDQMVNKAPNPGYATLGTRTVPREK
jgi:hypothetical protein